MRALKSVRQHLRSYHLKSGVFHFYRAEHGPAAEHLTRALEEEGAKLSSADRRSTVYYLVQTRIGAATKYEARGEMERAIEQYQLALAVMPRYPDVQVRLGDALARMGRSEEAIEHYHEALAVNPLYVQARVRLGFAHLRSGNHEAAHAAFLEAQEARETLSRRKLDDASRALAEGHEDVARDLYKDAFHEDLSLFQQLFDRGMAHLRDEAWEDAVEMLSQAADLCPRFADVHNYLGVALAEQEQLDAAIRSFHRSVAINPGYIVAWLNMAYAAWQAGDRELAETSLREVLEREADNAPAQHLEQQLSQRDEAPEKARTNDGGRRRAPRAAQE